MRILCKIGFSLCYMKFSCIQVHNILSCQFMETCFILQFVPYFYSDFGKCFCSYVFRFDNSIMFFFSLA